MENIRRPIVLENKWENILTKRRAGYSDLEISQKREALENVLVPYKLLENREMLMRAGFRYCDVFFKWYILQRVSRWGDLIGFGKTWQSMEFHWQRVVVKEYGSIFLWIATACVLMYKKHWQADNPFNNPAAAPWLWLLAASAVAYAVARYLKKSRILHAD